MSNHTDEQYLWILEKLINKGVYREDRNGGTYGLFGDQMRFDLSEGFPLLTTKKVHTNSIIVELLWFLSGNTNVKYLRDHGVIIWDEWADKNGDLGPVYGAQWRSWPSQELYENGDYKTIDQINNVIAGIKIDPYGRRHIVSAWNPSELKYMALPPCHCLFQFHVANGKLSCHLYQRSADWFLGVPFNIASYALLTHLIAREVGLEVGDFVHSFGDLHLYANHLDQAKEQLSREPKKTLPSVYIRPNVGGIFELTPNDIIINDYDYYPAIKAPVSK